LHRHGRTTQPPQWHIFPAPLPEALAALLGPDAPGLSGTTVRRLTEAWQGEHARWRERDLSARRYV